MLSSLNGSFSGAFPQLPVSSSINRLEVSNLALARGTTQLGPITFTLPQPGCYWLTGISGAGKSLLLESLAGFHAESTGSIRLNSEEIGNLAPERRSVTLMPQRWRLFPHWTVARNLNFAAGLSSSPSKRMQRLADQLQIAPLLARPVRGLSGGETQRVALIQTVLSPARIVLLDEPLSAIDASLQSILLDLLRREAAENRRILLIAAHKAPSWHPTDRTLYMENGQLVSETETSPTK